MAACLALAAPLVFLLCSTLWRMPYPLSESVAIFEDAQRNNPSYFLAPQGSYYRPLFFMTLSTIWHNSSLDQALVTIRLLHIIPIVAVTVLFVWHLRPKTVIDAAATTFGLMVLLGSPGFLDNLELPLSYTIVGMPLALGAWMLAERQYSRWHSVAIAWLVLIAVGFKEQGLVIVPVIAVAWLMGAPGIRRGTVVAIVLIAVAYVGLRLSGREGWPPFEQNVGYGFAMLSPDEAQQRFGAFPLWIYAYNGVSTIANVLFAEPTGGRFQIVADITQGDVQPWEFVRLLSSVGLTALIAWWSIPQLKNARRQEWSPESRTCVAAIVAVLACGALGFDYSRDRLGGMAVVFYAMAAFFAVRAVAVRALQMPAYRWVAIATVLLMLAGGWQLRATHTLEYTRQRAMNNRREWLTALHRRRDEFKDRAVYISIMERMQRRSVEPVGIVRTLYPRWFFFLVGE